MVRLVAAVETGVNVRGNKGDRGPIIALSLRTTLLSRIYKVL